MSPAADGARAAAPLAQTPTRTVRVGGDDIVYRELGEGRIPIVALIHLGANLDAWDPEVVDPLAVDRRVVMLGYRGVGSSTGRARDSFEDMAADALAAIRALGLTRVDLLGLSMGGMVAQAIVRQAPDLVRRLVLAGTGPQGGPGLTRMTGVVLRTAPRAVLSRRPMTSALFFPSTTDGTAAAAASQQRLRAPRIDRDARVAPGVTIAQLRAVSRWGAAARPVAPLTAAPALTFHGAEDVMIPVANVAALSAVLPALEPVVLPGAGHGALSPHRRAATARIRRFLDA